MEKDKGNYIQSKNSTISNYIKKEEKKKHAITWEYGSSNIKINENSIE